MKSKVLNIKGSRAVVALVIIVISMAVLSVYRQNEKSGYHIDELLTVILANNTSETRIEFNTKYDDGKAAIERFFTVNETNPAFNWKNVWENQHADTHPPFYYALVHFFFSLLPNFYSKWILYSINLVFAIMIVILFYLTSKLLFKDEKVITVFTAFFAINPAFIEITTFLRMYTTAMFWCMLFTFLIVYAVEKCDKKFFVGNTIVLLAGTLTHYYFIIYAFFSYCVLAVILLKNKRKKEFIFFIISSALGTGITILFFPGIGYHLLKQGRGVENISNFTNTAAWGERIIAFFKLVSQELWGGVLLLGVIGAAIGIACMRKKMDKVIRDRIRLCGVTGIGYFIVVSIIASYIADRYMSLAYPVLVLSLLYGNYFVIAWIREKFGTMRIQYLFFVSLFIVTVVAYIKYDWNEYGNLRYKESIKPKVMEVAENDCIFLSDGNVWGIVPSYLELTEYNSLTFVDFRDETKWDIDINSYSSEKLVVYLQDNAPKELLNEVLEKFERFEGYEAIHTDYTGNCAYVFY